MKRTLSTTMTSHIDRKYLTNKQELYTLIKKAKSKKEKDNIINLYYASMELDMIDKFDPVRIDAKYGG